MTKHIWTEDAGGYFCRVCGANHSDEDECLGYAPDLTYAIRVAIECLRGSLGEPAQAYNEETRRRALDTFKDYYDPRRDPGRVRSLR